MTIPAVRPTVLVAIAVAAQLLAAVLLWGDPAPLALVALAIVLSTAAGAEVATRSRSLTQAIDEAERLARGDLSGPSASGDELVRALGDAGARTREAMRDVVDSSASLNGTADAVASATATMGDAFAETSAQAAEVSAAAGTVSQSVAVVSNGASELRDSITEIARNVTEAVGVAQEAVALAGTTTTVMAELGESSVQIENVVRLITSIAGQTNLLALNATIEASRAGEAGRGFAVVAGEVKALAQETARATEDVTARVRTLQDGARGATASIQQTRAVIERFADYQTTIASAVEQQTATTAEMSGSLAEAAVGSARIAETVGTVATSAALALEQLGHAQGAARELAALATDLGEVAGRFEMPRREVVVNALGPEGGIALQVDGAVSVIHDPELNAVIVRWLRYADEAVKPALGKQLELIKTLGLATVIVDSSEAIGAYSAQMNQWIGQEFVPQMMRTSLRGFVTVVPRSAVADLANKGWQENTDAMGFPMVEVATVAEAERFARERR